MNNKPKLEMRTLSFKNVRVSYTSKCHKTKTNKQTNKQTKNQIKSINQNQFNFNPKQKTHQLPSFVYIEYVFGFCFPLSLEGTKKPSFLHHTQPPKKQTNNTYFMYSSKPMICPSICIRASS